MRSERYRNGMLTIIAVLLGLLLLQGSGGDLPRVVPETQAWAQPSEDPVSGGLISASEQRKIMIAELRRLGVRLDRIESKINAGINVKVTDMPEIKLPKDNGK